MSEAKRFEIIGGKVVAHRDAAAASAFRCTMCKIREKQVADAKEEVRQQEKKIGALKEELYRIQNAQAHKREAYSSVDAERKNEREAISVFAKTLALYLKYVRVILWTLKTLRDHPPGGFCVACEKADGEHDPHCMIAKLFDEPARVIAEHRDVQINERDLAIPDALHVQDVEFMVEKPWAMFRDMTKMCRGGDRDHPCPYNPIKGKLFCPTHMPKGY